MKGIEDFENITLKIKNLVNNKHFIINENLYDKWASSNNISNLLKNVEYNELKEKIKVLIPNAPLGFNYFFDEKFFLWALQNGFSEYLK